MIKNKRWRYIYIGKEMMTKKLSAIALGLILAAIAVVALLGKFGIAPAFLNFNRPPDVVELYIHDQCKDPCWKAADFMSRLGISYKLYNVSASAENMGRFQALREKRVPVVTLGRKKLIGFTESEYLKLLHPFLTKPGGLTPEKAFKVVLFSRSNCDYCDQAKALFQRYRVPYFEYNIDTSPEGLEKFTCLRGYGTPLIFIGPYRFNGFDESKIFTALQTVAKSGSAN